MQQSNLKLSILPEWMKILETTTDQETFMTYLAVQIQSQKIDFASGMMASLTFKKPSVFFNKCKELGLLKDNFPALHANIGCQQNPDYHEEDVFDHTMTCLDNLSVYIDSSQIKLSTELMFSMRAALLFHDLGKESTKSME